MFYANEFAGRRIRRDRQLCVVAIRPIDDVPDQLVGIAIPVAYVGNGRIVIFLQNFIPTVLLRSSKSLIRIRLEEGHVEYLSGRV